MNNLLGFLILSGLFIGSAAFSQEDESIFEPAPDQSMSITGKGPVQDAAINPYSGQTGMAVVSNEGEIPFSIRIQKDGQILTTMAVARRDTISAVLEKGHELCLDSDPEAKAKVDFKPYP